MALFRATIKSTRLKNGMRLEKGMSVDFLLFTTVHLGLMADKKLLTHFNASMVWTLKKWEQCPLRTLMFKKSADRFSLDRKQIKSQIKTYTK
ncbi:MAG: hypothetical protein XD81_0230 [Bacteroidetes bacterium 38_7]|nr:MAG: hypothetical protein XD81_0230 [Bacteroidetes bacterium 38_7]